MIHKLFIYSCHLISAAFKSLLKEQIVRLSPACDTACLNGEDIIYKFEILSDNTLYILWCLEKIIITATDNYHVNTLLQMCINLFERQTCLHVTTTHYTCTSLLQYLFQMSINYIEDRRQTNITLISKWYWSFNSQCTKRLIKQCGCWLGLLLVYVNYTSSPLYLFI